MMSVLVPVVDCQAVRPETAHTLKSANVQARYSTVSASLAGSPSILLTSQQIGHTIAGNFTIEAIRSRLANVPTAPQTQGTRLFRSINPTHSWIT